MHNYIILGCSLSKFKCLYDKAQFGIDYIAISKAYSKDRCSEKCCATAECIGFDWDESSMNCYLSKTPWIKVPLSSCSRRHACELIETGND